MAKNKKKGGGVVLWSVLTGVSAVAFGAACVGTNLANASAQAVNIALKTSTNKTVGKDDSVKYFETGFDSVEDLEAHDKEIAEQLTGEGAVLLKNNGALPLAAGSKISTLSHSSVGIATCGTGSADIDTSKAPTLKEALEADLEFILESAYPSSQLSDAGVRVQSSPDPDARMVNMVTRTEKRRNTADRRIGALERQAQQIEDVLSAILDMDSQSKCVLLALYYPFRSYKEAADFLHMAKATIYRQRKTALDSLFATMYKSDSFR